MSTGKKLQEANWLFTANNAVYELTVSLNIVCGFEGLSPIHGKDLPVLEINGNN